MSMPRRIVPGRVYMVTRRCTQRQFLLRPNRETTNAFIYCRALAAGRTDMRVWRSWPIPTTITPSSWTRAAVCRKCSSCSTSWWPSTRTGCAAGGRTSGHRRRRPWSSWLGRTTPRQDGLRADESREGPAGRQGGPVAGGDVAVGEPA